MISGMNLWDETITYDMGFETYRGEMQYTYQNKPKNLYQVLCNSASRLPDKPALIDSFGNTVSYAELLQRVNSLSLYLYEKYAVSKGCHVGILLYNSAEFCVSFLALCRLGALSVPISTKYKAQEICETIERADLTVMIADEGFLPLITGLCNERKVSILSCGFSQEYGFQSLGTQIDHSLPEEADLEDDVILMFTSGTTSKSKGVILSNFNTMHAIISYQRILDLSENDVTLLPIPLYHITGLVAVLALFIHVGATIVLHKTFDAEKVLQTMQRERVTFFHASPTVFLKLLEKREKYPKLTTLQKFACGSANMPVKAIEEIKNWLPNVAFHTVYGLTETTSPASIFPFGAATSPRIGSSGKPIPGVEMKVVDDTGNEVPTGEAGELLVKGAVVLERYYKHDSSEIEDGWLKTGDIARLTEDGYLYLIDRKKDMINRGGEKVWSYEVENALMNCPGVLDAAVVGVPDEIYGEKVGALICRESGSLAEEDIKLFLQPRLAKYKIPAVYLFAKEIPKTAGNKVDKKEIRNLVLFESKKERCGEC